MTPAAQVLWRRLQSRAAQLSPTLQRAIRAAFEQLASSVSNAELERFVRGADWERLFTSLVDERDVTAAFQRVRDALRSGIADATQSAIRMLPAVARGISFDFLAPTTITAVRTLEDRAIRTLAKDTVEAIRAYAEQGLREGVNPLTVARQIKPMFGLGIAQVDWVANYRRELERTSLTALQRARRDKRGDALIRRLAKEGGELTPAQIERMVDAYEQKLISLNAETNARTLALDSQRLAQHLAWEQAVAQGVVDGNNLYKRWSGVLDSHERPTHVAMEGDTVKWDEPFSNGQMLPGDDEYNCRCIAHYFVGR